MGTEPKEFWNHRARLLGHTGWSNRAVYNYDQPIRLRAVISTIKGLFKDLNALRILDVGCGTGDLVAELSKRGPDITGIDASNEVLSIARKRLATASNVQFHVCNVQDYQDESHSFDLITSVTVLQHLTENSDLSRALQRMRSLLKSDGYLILLELIPNARHKNSQGEHVVSRSREQWITYLKDAGFLLAGERGFPQIGILLIQFLGSIRNRSKEKATQVAEVSRNESSFIKALVSRMVLIIAYPFDQLLRLPTPKSLSLYKIMIFKPQKD